MLYYSFLCLAWNIIAGFGGQLSLGHPVFYGIGAYTTAKLFIEWNVSPWCGMVVGMILAGLAGLAIGSLCFRYNLKGIFFALVTLAFAEICRIVVMEVQALGGPKGLLIPLIGGNSIPMAQFSDKKGYFFWMLGLTVIAVVITIKIKKSRFGYYLLALKDDEEAARALGINTNRCKIYATVLSAGLTALGGSFYGQYTLVVHPEHAFGVGVTIEIIVRSIIGGMGTIAGPIVGSFIMEPVSEITRAFFGGIQGLNLLIRSIFMGAVIIFMPRGLVHISSGGFKRKLVKST